MKTKPIGTRIIDAVGKYFPIRTFVFSLLALLILFLLSTGAYVGIFSKVESPAVPTGKIVATIQVTEKSAPEAVPVPPSKDLAEPAQTDPPPPVNPDVNLEDDPLSASSIKTPSIEDSLAGLSEETTDGPLPIIRPSDKMKSVDAYKAPFTLKPETKTVISLVMVDFGLSEKYSKMAIASLPPATTFVASPFADNLQSKTSEARAKGMEIWVQLPVQGQGKFSDNDTGPSSIQSGLTFKENQERIKKHLGRTTGYAGVAIVTSPAYKENSTNLSLILESLVKRGLGLTQIEPTDTVIASCIRNLPVPFIQSAFWIDEIQTKDLVLQSLQQAELKALERGGFVVIGFHPSPLVFSVINDWKNGLSAKNIQIAPLTYTSKQNIMTINQPPPETTTTTAINPE